MRRIGQIINLQPDAYAQYKRLHAEVWPEVLTTIYAANIRNYSIYHFDGVLFAYMEYVGDNFDEDMAKLADDPKTREWWLLTDPLQKPVVGNSSGSVEGNWWHDMEELFHTD